VGRVVIATAEFAPIPPFHLPVYPGGFIPTAIGMRFRGMTESIGPMWSKTKNLTSGVGGGEKVCHFGGQKAPVEWLRYG